MLSPLRAFRIRGLLSLAVLLAVTGGFAAVAAQPANALMQTSTAPAKGGDDRNGP